MHIVSIEALVERRVSRPIIARKKGGGARPPLSGRRSRCARLTDADPTEQLSGRGAGTPDPPAFEESIITATYTFDIFSSLDGFGSHNGNWAATGASKTPSCWLTASPCTIRSSG